MPVIFAHWGRFSQLVVTQHPRWHLRQYLGEEKDKFPYNPKIHSNIREKFSEFINNLDEFQRELSEKGN